VIVAKHFQLTIADGRFQYARNQQAISEEAALDGLYVLRTSVAGGDLSPQAVVRAYKLLAHAERAFRAMNSPELEIRPLHHRLEDRVRAHLFLCMLAYTIRFEIEDRLSPLLFKDDTPLAPADPVAPAQRSPAATRKAASKKTEDGLPVSSFRDLLDALSTLCRNRIRLRGSQANFEQLTEQNNLQRRAFKLLELNPTARRQDKTRHLRREPLPKRDRAPRARKLPANPAR
jgi:hypothetical protein